jgi:hypothetical protein
MMAHECVRDEKQDWIHWFKGSRSVRAKEKLKAAEQIQIPLSKDIAGELTQFAQCDAAVGETELRRALESMSLDQLQAYVSREKVLLDQHSASWMEKRRHGWRKVTTNLQSFVDSFDGLLKAYYPVVEVAVLADSSYGGAATMTLAILFTVGQFKI